jgi:glycosyltransferase involved in cell wall biosynthesis
MKICFYTSTALPKRGGQEAVVDRLARQFLELGHQVVVLAPRPRRPLKADDRGSPYPVVRHPRFYSMRLVNWYRWFLLRLLHGGGFDVLHCHGIYPPGYIAAFCRERISLPIALTSHGSINGARADTRWGRRNIQALTAADGLVALSALIETNYRRLCPTASLIVRIPNGVDLTPGTACQRPPGLDPTIDSGNYLLFLGRLHRRKGVDRLLRAFALASGVKPFQLVLAGQGNQEQSLRTSVRELGLDNSVRFVGWVEGEMKAYLLQNALCTVVPSRWPEAFPLVVLESYAAGRPVLASAVGGLKELVVAGETGLLVEPESVTGWAQAIRQLFHEPHRADLLGKQANRWVQNYSWKAVAERHIELYAALVDARSVDRAQPGKPSAANN